MLLRMLKRLTGLNSIIAAHEVSLTWLGTFKHINSHHIHSDRTLQATTPLFRLSTARAPCESVPVQWSLIYNHCAYLNNNRPKQSLHVLWPKTLFFIIQKRYIFVKARRRYIYLFTILLYVHVAFTSVSTAAPGAPSWSCARDVDTWDDAGRQSAPRLYSRRLIYTFLRPRVDRHK